MKISQRFLVLFLLSACGRVEDGATSRIFASETIDRPFVVDDQWNGNSVSVRIPSHYLDLERVTFARVPSQSNGGDFPAPAHEVRLNVEGDHLLLNNTIPPYLEVARWKITGNENGDRLVAPVSARAEEIYFHDVRSATEGLWFHETVLSPDANSGPDRTWSVYLLPTTGTPEFTPQRPVKEIGYLVNYRDVDQAEIYDDQEPFNPNDLFITKWHNRGTIRWVINRSVPAAFLPFVIDGILAWNEVLPKGMTFSARVANPDEELDGPFTNAVVYQPTMTDSRAAASFTFFPATGEIFRATIVIGRLPEQVDGHGPKLRGSVSHEIGHALGLRHNFKGSLYDQNLAAYPAGSSIMEYPELALDGQRNIGPYDRDAILWAYADSSATTKYPFCTDEKQGIDPTCQGYDPTSSTPFEALTERARNLIDRQVNRLDDLANVPFGRSQLEQLGPYLRLPETPFYDANKNAEVDALFARFLERASASPTPVGAPAAARLVQRIVDGAEFMGLSESQLKNLLPTLEAFNAWRAANPSP